MAAESWHLASGESQQNSSRATIDGVVGRETKALLLLADFRYLTRFQIEEFLFDATPVRAGSKQVITRRILTRLEERAVIAPIARLAAGLNGGSGRLVYGLTRVGERVVDSIHSARGAARTTQRTAFLMKHSLATAEVALAFQRCARVHVGHEVLLWECEWRPSKQVGSCPVVPDAHVVYRTPEYELEAFIEVDLGTERPGFFAAKMNSYLSLYRSGGWRGQLVSWPVVLTVAPDDVRARILSRVTDATFKAESIEAEVRQATEFRFTTLGRLQRLTGALAEVWPAAGLERALEGS
jgi:hypothetical protein